MKRPNFKKLAEHYRNLYFVEQERALLFARDNAQMSATLIEKEQELDEWQTKYVQVLNQLIDLQGRVARKEGQG